MSRSTFRAPQPVLPAYSPLTRDRRARLARWMNRVTSAHIVPSSLPTTTDPTHLVAFGFQGRRRPHTDPQLFAYLWIQLCFPGRASLLMRPTCWEPSPAGLWLAPRSDRAEFIFLAFEFLQNPATPKRLKLSIPGTNHHWNLEPTPLH